MKKVVQTVQQVQALQTNHRLQAQVLQKGHLVQVHQRWKKRECCQTNHHRHRNQLMELECCQIDQMELAHQKVLVQVRCRIIPPVLVLQKGHLVQVLVTQTPGPELQMMYSELVFVQIKIHQ